MFGCFQGRKCGDYGTKHETELQQASWRTTRTRSKKPFPRCKWSSTGDTHWHPTHHFGSLYFFHACSCLYPSCSVRFRWQIHQFMVPNPLISLGWNLGSHFLDYVIYMLYKSISVIRKRDPPANSLKEGGVYHNALWINTIWNSNVEMWPCRLHTYWFLNVETTRSGDLKYGMDLL